MTQATARQSSPSAIHLTGTVDSIRFQSAETGWVCAKVTFDNKKVSTLVGIAPNLSPGETVEVDGKWGKSKWGEQFEASTILVRPPVSTAGLLAFLSSGMIDGVGPVYAKKLVNIYGLNLIDILDHRPNDISIVKGIGKERAARIKEAWRKHKDIREILMFLQEHGITANRAMKIYKRYKSRSLSILKTNPYRLAEEMVGFGFVTADTIAKQMGVSPTAPVRLRAGLLFTLLRKEQQGHCALPQDDLVHESAKLLEIDIATAEHAITKCLEHGYLVEDDVGGEKLIYSPELYTIEEQVAQRITELNAGKSPWSTIDHKKSIARAEKSLNVSLSASQSTALECVLPRKVAVVTGGPGTGKSTLLKTLLTIINKHEKNIVLCAPTGRAARRMEEASGFEAVTIHRLLGAHGGNKFTYNESNKLDMVVLAGDEWGMVNIRLFNSLLAALPDQCCLIICGDVDQLDAVGPGAILKDMIDSGVITTVRLTEIHRQAEHSDIIINAHRINSGLMPVFNEHSTGDFQLFIENSPEGILRKIDEIMSATLPQRYGINPIIDSQVLAPLHRGDLGTIALNKRLQQLLNPNPVESFNYGDMRFGVGDKVIQTVNNYDKAIFNGDTGLITHIDKRNKILRVNFDGQDIAYTFDDLDELALALCISSHKSQGSEYKAVILPVSNAHYIMLNRRLLYTSVTRGKELVIVVAEEKALRTAIFNDRGEKRVTGLAHRLQ